MKNLIILIGVCCLGLINAGTLFTDRGRGEEPKAEKWPRIDQTQYVGSKKCAECHQTHYDGWKDTAHNKMIRPPIDRRAGPNRSRRLQPAEPGRGSLS